MRIAMISYHTCPLAILGGKDTGGMNVYVRELTRELGRLGIHVDVFTRSQDEHVPSVLHDLGYGNRVVHVPAGPEVPLPKQELAEYISAFSDYVLEFAAKKGCTYDLIHSHYWLSGMVAEELQKAWGSPIVHMFHTLGLMKQRVAQNHEEAEGEYRIRGEHQVLKIANRIVAATVAEMAQLQWLYQADRDNIVVIPPGVDTSHFYPIPPDEAREFIGAPPDSRILLYVGRIEPLKGVDTLIQAIAKLAKRGDLSRHNFCMSIVGGEPEANREAMTEEMVRLQNLSSDYGLDEFVTFLGRRSQDTLPYYYSAADVVVMPSHYESFGMVALEAMACGTPVVASQVGGLAFLVQDGETGYHIPVGDVDALSDRLAQLLDDDQLHERISRQAAIFAQDYAWDIVAERVVDVYTEVWKQQIK